MVNVLAHKDDAVYSISCSVWYYHHVLISAIHIGVEWHLTVFNLTPLIFSTFWWSCILFSKIPVPIFNHFLIDLIWGNTFWAMKTRQVSLRPSYHFWYYFQYPGRIPWKPSQNLRFNQAHSSASQPTNIRMELWPFYMSVLRFEGDIRHKRVFRGCYPFGEHDLYLSVTCSLISYLSLGSTDFWAAKKNRCSW